MATIRKRGQKWQVQVRRQGNASLCRSFLRKADAEIWARQLEAEADRRGLPFDPKQLEKLTVADMVARYRDTIVPRKQGREIETIILNAFLRSEVASLTLSEITSAHFSAYRDQRLACVKAATINRELGVLQHAFDIAIREWSLPLRSNPVAAISKPRLDKPRDRRLRDGEEERLIEACRKCRNPLIPPLISFALETGMRRGEIVSVRWQDADLQARTLHIAKTKNGYPRTIPLTQGALSILKELAARQTTDDRLFPLSIESVKLAWKRVVKRAGIEDLHFHDLRHEAVSRFFERGLSVPEVALISGHRDPRMLFRYTHLRAEDVAAKLR